MELKKNLTYRPFKIQLLDQNDVKIQNSILPKFEISIFQKLGFRKMKNWDTKTKISIFKEFGKVRNRTSKPKIRFNDFDIPGPRFNFENFKIDFSYSFRISIRDPKIRIHRYRKSPNLDFRFKIQIFLRPKS